MEITVTIEVKGLLSLYETKKGVYDFVESEFTESTHIMYSHHAPFLSVSVFDAIDGRICLDVALRQSRGERVYVFDNIENTKAFMYNVLGLPEKEF